jgi:hypothetical protein
MDDIGRSLALHAPFHQPRRKALHSRSDTRGRGECRSTSTTLFSYLHEKLDNFLKAFFLCVKPLSVIGKTLLASGPWWAAAFAHMASNFGIYFFPTQLPTYMKDNLKFDFKMVEYLFFCHRSLNFEKNI